MNSTIKKTLKKYNTIGDTFRYAYVGFPKGFGGIKEAFFGTHHAFNKLYPHIVTDRTYPAVLYMHGSSGLCGGDVYRRHIVEELGFVFFAPNSHMIANRPVYQSPAKMSTYRKVHKVRVAEIHYNYKQLIRCSFADTENIFLMGNSEGGLAAAIFKSKKFAGRIITAFSCESCYFYENFKLGSRKGEPFLNIIGTHDEFFAKDSKLNKTNKVSGNGIEKLKDYKNAKVVILPKAKHDLTKNIYVKDEIVSFLKLWSRG